MEEGLLSGNSEDIRIPEAPSVTPAVVLSTFVTACGSLSLDFLLQQSQVSWMTLGYLLQNTLFGSILTFGGMIGALLSGRVADIFGRRVTMWLLEIFFTLGWILIFFGKNALWLDTGRLLMGIGAGLHCYVAPIYIAEISPKNTRGTFTATITTVTFGFSLMFFVGNFMAWRMLAIVGALPCLVHMIGVFFIPESPRWLAKIGKDKGVEASLQHLREKNNDIYSEAAEIKDYTMMIQQLPQSRFRDLFDRKYAHPLIVGLGLMILVQFGGTDGVSSFTGSIFSAAGFSAGIGSTVMVVIQLPSALLSVLLMDKLGRRTLLMVTAAGSCIGYMITGMGFWFKNFTHLKEITPTMAFVIYSASFSAGMGGTPWVIMSEIFPINIKGTGGSLVTLGNWFSSWIVTYAFNFLFQWSSAGVFFVFAAVCSLIILFVVKLVPETKGRTLEEIQASMTLLK